MKKIVKITICLIISNNLFGQNPVFELKLNEKLDFKKALSKSIGKDWELFDYTIGDINNDKKEDIIVIGNSLTNKEKNRKIYLFVNQKGNKYKIMATNSNIVECSECGGGGVGDPFRQTIIKKNYFSFELLYGACQKTSITVTFKYDTKKKWWFLHKSVNEDYNNCANNKNTEGEIKITETQNYKSEYGKLKFENYK
jgi:hypothetical protein